MQSNINHILIATWRELWYEHRLISLNVRDGWKISNKIIAANSRKIFFESSVTKLLSMRMQKYISIFIGNSHTLANVAVDGFNAIPFVWLTRRLRWRARELIENRKCMCMQTLLQKPHRWDELKLCVFDDKLTNQEQVCPTELQFSCVTD